MSRIHSTQEKKIRIIQTARTEKSINAATKKGFRPLVKLVMASTEIRSKFRVLQNKITGEVHVQGDYRALFNSDWEVVVNWTYFYPHQWSSPFAAYLIPPDIEEGEVVILKDLIEDTIGSKWNQGDVYRLKSCRATWTGKDFVLHHDPDGVLEFLG